MPKEYRNYLSLSYGELEELNLEAKEGRRGRVSPDRIREDRIRYLVDTKGIRVVTVLFSDLEGRLHIVPPKYPKRSAIIEVD
jgi:glutamine synthetase